MNLTEIDTKNINEVSVIFQKGPNDLLNVVFSRVRLEHDLNSIP